MPVLRTERTGIFVSQQQRPSIFDAFEMFLLDCKARQFTKHTLRFYRGRLILFVRWCAEHGLDDLGAVTPIDLRRYLVDTQQRNVSSAYLHSHARALRTFFNYCVRDQLLDTSPFARVQMPRLEKKILESLSPYEINRLISFCTCERDHALILFLLDSGVRASELCALDIDDIDLSSGAVQVRLGKGQKGRTVFIGARTRKQLLRYLRLERAPGSKPLFVSQRRDTRLTYSGVAQILKRLGRDAGVSHCSAHAFRRTFAINCLRGGMNIYVLAKLMGHTDILVLRQYLSLVQDDLMEAHALAAVVDRMVGQAARQKRGPPEQ
jgi:integrase/recombinase XerD